MAKRNKKSRKGKKAIKIILVLLILACLTLFLLFHFGILGKEDLPLPKKKEPTQKLKILDLDSKTRPYAVMIDNVKGAKPQSGLDKAYLVYEIVVEGGLTRLMAVFKDVDVNEIGPVRSARHYFVDYAMENDAIFVHHGRSPQALEQINKYDVDDLEGLYNPSKIFWRDKNRAAPHNSYTSSSGIEKAIKDKNYDNESDDWLLLNYSVKKIDLSKKDGAQKADKVVVHFSDNVYSTMEYDSEKELYYRYENGVEHSDRNGTQYTVKNIIVVEGIRNYTIETTKNRQEIENIGSGEGHFISNGYAVPITWEKKSETSKTVYKYLNGNEIKVNDGNTYIELQPYGKTLEIVSNETTSN